MLRDRVDVEVHPRRDEEDGDEEAVADRVELLLQRVDVTRCPPAQDDAGQEGPEHHVEAETARHREQPHQQDDGPAQGRL